MASPDIVLAVEGDKTSKLHVSEPFKCSFGPRHIKFIT